MSFFNFKDISGFSMQTAMQSALQTVQGLMFTPTINVITGSPNSGPKTENDLTNTQTPRQEPKIDQIMPVFSPGATGSTPITDIASQFPTGSSGDDFTTANMFDKKTLLLMMLTGGAILIFFPKKKK